MKLSLFKNFKTTSNSSRDWEIINNMKRQYANEEQIRDDLSFSFESNVVPPKPELDAETLIAKLQNTINFQQTSLELLQLEINKLKEALSLQGTIKPSDSDEEDVWLDCCDN